jgi:hypothetical protein
LLHTRHIPAAVWDELMDVRKRIIAGELRIEPIEDTARVHALMSAVTPAAR